MASSRRQRPYYRAKRQLEALLQHPDAPVRRLAHHLQKWHLVHDLSLSPSMPSSGSLDDRIRRALPRDVWGLVCTFKEPTTLDLSGCQELTAEQACFLFTLCPDINTLSLIDVGSMPETCPRLTALSVSCGSKTSEIAPRFCPALTSLHLTGGMVIKNEIKALGRMCPQLRHLHVGDLDWNGDELLRAIASHFPNLASLEIANRVQNVLAGDMLAIARRCPRLTRLSVESLYLREEDLVLLAGRLPALKSLSVYFPSIQRDLFSKLAEAFSGLERLELGGGEWDLDLGEVVRSPQLTDLDLSDGYQDLSISSLLDRCPALVRLKLRSAQVVVPPPTLTFALTHLDLSGSTLFRDDSLAHIVQSLPRLTHLDLTSCVSLSDAGVESVMRSCTELARLLLGSDLWHPIPLSDRSLHHIAAHGQHLTHLTLGPLLGANESRFRSLLDRCRKLVQVNLKDATFLSEDVFDLMGQHPCLQRFSTNLDLDPDLLLRLRRHYPLLEVVVV